MDRKPDLTKYSLIPGALTKPGQRHYFHRPRGTTKWTVSGRGYSTCGPSGCNDQYEFLVDKVTNEDGEYGP